MQTSKISLFICAGAVCAVPLLSRAEDTPEQTKLREALHQAMTGANTTPTAPMEVSASVASGESADAKLRDALHQAMSAPANPTPAMTTPAEPPATAITESAPVAAPAMEQTAMPPSMASSDNQDARLLDALHAAMAKAGTYHEPNEMSQPDNSVPAPAPMQPAMETPMKTPEVQSMTTETKPATIETPVSAAPEMPAAASATPAETAPVAAPEMTPMPAASVENPAMPAAEAVMQPATTNEAAAESQAMEQAPKTMPTITLTAEQREQLQSLLGLYKADKISPQEYHAQRAKILGL